MPLADHTTHTIPEDAIPSRSWRSRLLRYLPRDEQAPPNAFIPPPKPYGEIADLLFMSALDQKMPPATSGSAEVLDAIVQDHLAQAPAEQAAAALADPPAEPAVDSAVPAIAPDLSDEDRSALLQREIETLLRDTGPAAAPASEPASEPPAAANSDITPEELDTLLADQAQSMTPELSTDAPGTPSAQTVQQLAEAEGVLAEELNQLMADNPPAPVPAAPASTAKAPAAQPIAPTSATSKSESISPSTTAAPASTTTAPVADASITPASTAAPAGPLPLTPEEAKAAAEAQAAEALQAAAASKPQERQLLHDLALLAAQIIDLPFGWLSELDKNVIGVAAFLLLLGGVVLFTLSRYVH